LNDVDADLIITGELSHHEILHEVHRGVSLIVTDHSNTERGFLQIFKSKFQEILQTTNEIDKDLQVFIAQTDNDPLEYI
jgi:putative NIF3 family GTP cyclohydrolase 1 type 2